MPAKQLDGRIAQAMLVAAQPLHLAWGTGKPEWDVAPEAEPVDAEALINEVGRRSVTQVGYVLPDDDGEIETPQGNYALSGEPTRYLYIRTTFAFDDAVHDQIRELGLFIGSKPVDGLPPGQRYFTPEQIENAGRLLILDRSQNFQRNGAVRPAFEYIMPF